MVCTPGIETAAIKLPHQSQTRSAHNASEKLVKRVVKLQKRHATNSEHAYNRYSNLVKKLEINHLDQVWASDITCIRLDQGFVCLTIMMGVYTRSICGWCLSKRLDQGLSLRALEMTLLDYVPEIQQSDQVVQYATNTYTVLLTAISMSAAGRSQENGYMERFMRAIKEEEVELSEYWDIFDAQKQISHFIVRIPDPS